MSYFVVGVGGTGAKLVESLIHLSAAGLLGDVHGQLEVLLVDPDEANGNVEATRALSVAYDRCKRLQLGTTDLFSTKISLEGPWTPVVNQKIATLSTIFGYTQMRENNPEEADLMELLFPPEERDLTIFQGFRGRPAIGSTIFAKAVNFKTGAWSEFLNAVRAAASGQESVPVLLAGSVFGGSGAAGVPTICRLVEGGLKEVTKNVRLGLVLFLPYFQFKPVEGEQMQANPHTFSTATAESLKYYDEGRFLDRCHSIYALGEEAQAEMTVSAVGAQEQRNDPHFIELVAGLGAVRFMGGGQKRDQEHTVSLAVRQASNTLRWADLPMAEGQQAVQIARLQRMALFAVAFRYIFYPNILDDLQTERKRHNFVIEHLVRKGILAETAARDLEAVNGYAEAFLLWLLRLSTPRGLNGFLPGLVKLNVFAVPEGDTWRLKTPGVSGKGEFRDKEIEELFLNADGKVRPRFKDIWHGASMDVKDAGAAGTGRLVRAMYDACKLS